MATTPIFSNSEQLDADSIRKRMRTRVSETTTHQEDTNTILAEILNLQVAMRFHLRVLSVVAVIGVVASVICAVIIAVQVTQANKNGATACASIYSCR